VFFDVTVASCLDCVEQLSSLLRDPVFFGDGISHGEREPVLLVPGFFAGDWMMAPMAQWLTRIGYRPYLSGIDLNFGCPREQARRLLWRMRDIYDDTGTRVSIVGHSLGGVLARALGQSAWAMAGRIVTIGAPARSDWAAVNRRLRPAMESVAVLWQTMLGSPAQCGTSRCDCGFFAGGDSAGAANITSIYSRRDEVVDWRSCIDPRGHSLEVQGRHFGLIVNRDVYRLVAEILAAGRAKSSNRFVQRAAS
jgi:pimeloyl-ACP methyl ester carboxylesterase